MVKFYSIFRATHNLYQLVKRHQKQAAQAEETPDQLNQVHCLSLLSFSLSMSLVCFCQLGQIEAMSSMTEVIYLMMI